MLMQYRDLAKNIIKIYQKHGRDWTQLRGDFLHEKICHCGVNSMLSSAYSEVVLLRVVYMLA